MKGGWKKSELKKLEKKAEQSSVTQPRQDTTGKKVISLKRNNTLKSLKGIRTKSRKDPAVKTTYLMDGDSQVSNKVEKEALKKQCRGFLESVYNEALQSEDPQRHAQPNH